MAKYQYVSYRVAVAFIAVVTTLYIFMANQHTSAPHAGAVPRYEYEALEKVIDRLEERVQALERSRRGYYPH